MTNRELMDADGDGENMAVRAFLQLYGCNNCPTVKEMRNHLSGSGFPGCWPAWAGPSKVDQHLTKGGAQDWLRYLFSLETK